MLLDDDGLIVTPTLARRVERAFTRYTEATLQPVLAEAGNPKGVEIRRFGSATAFLSRKMPMGWMYNRVAHLTEADLVPEIVAFYRQNGMLCRVEVIPADFKPGLAEALVDNGMCPFGFDVALAGVLFTRSDGAASEVEVRVVSSDEELDLFLDVRQDSWEAKRIPSKKRERARTNLRLPGLSHFLAYVDGQPAGAATLFVSDGVGYLALAATRPAFRRRGCHTALLRARQEAAAYSGCDLVVGMTGFGSISQNNMERAGLKIVHTRVIWTERQPHKEEGGSEPPSLRR